MSRYDAWAPLVARAACSLPTLGRWAEPHTGRERRGGSPQSTLQWSLRRPQPWTLSSPSITTVRIAWDEARSVARNSKPSSVISPPAEGPVCYTSYNGIFLDATAGGCWAASTSISELSSLGVPASVIVLAVLTSSNTTAPGTLAQWVGRARTDGVWTSGVVAWKYSAQAGGSWINTVYPQSVSLATTAVGPALTAVQVCDAVVPPPPSRTVSPSTTPSPSLPSNATATASVTAAIAAVESSRSAGPPWPVIGGTIGGAAALLFIVLVVMCCRASNKDDMSASKSPPDTLQQQESQPAIQLPDMKVEDARRQSPSRRPPPAPPPPLPSRTQRSPSRPGRGSAASAPEIPGSPVRSSPAQLRQSSGTFVVGSGAEVATGSPARPASTINSAPRMPPLAAGEEADFDAIVETRAVAFPRGSPAGLHVETSEASRRSLGGVALGVSPDQRGRGGGSQISYPDVACRVSAGGDAFPPSHRGTPRGRPAYSVDYAAGDSGGVPVPPPCLAAHSSIRGSPLVDPRRLGSGRYSSASALSYAGNAPHLMSADDAPLESTAAGRDGGSRMSVAVRSSPHALPRPGSRLGPEREQAAPLPPQHPHQRWGQAASDVRAPSGSLQRVNTSASASSQDPAVLRASPPSIPYSRRRSSAMDFASPVAMPANHLVRDGSVRGREGAAY